MNLRKLAEHQPCYLRELWKPVPGFEDFYEVSDQGRLRSCERTVSMNYGSRKRTYPSKIMQTGIAENGYPYVSLCKNGKKTRFSVHRLVASVFVVGEGPLVRHLNGNSADCRATNLAWGSQTENEADKRAHGRLLFGESHPMASLDEQRVLEIRSKHANGVTQTNISLETGIPRSTIQAIVTKRLWKHLP